MRAASNRVSEEPEQGEQRLLMETKLAATEGHLEQQEVEVPSWRTVQLNGR
jgi:hypothetical protein